MAKLRRMKNKSTQRVLTKRRAVGVRRRDVIAKDIPVAHLETTVERAKYYTP